MTNSMFTSIMNSVNALFYFGHGATGIVAFPNACSSLEGGNTPPSSTYWGIGDLAGQYPKATGALNSTLYLGWMFLFSSDTVAPDAEQDSSDASNAPGAVANPWEPLFYNSGIPLHGIYGYWQSPGECTVEGAEDNRACDVESEDNPPVASMLLQQIWNPTANGGADILDAWQQSNEDNNESTSWSAEMDNDYAVLDTFSGTPSRSQGGVLEFDSPYTGLEYTDIVVKPVAGVLNPVADNNETLNVASAVASGDSAMSAGSYTTVTSGGTTTYTSVGGLQVTYYQGTSGGVTYHGHALENPMAVSLSTAETAATEFVDNSFGMPSDATLSDVISFYLKVTGGTNMLIGYEFVWTHSSGPVFGGDAIKVDVEDYHYIGSSTCEEWIEDGSHFICGKYVYTYDDEPNVSYGYRLWRSTGGGVGSTISRYDTGTNTIDAYTASLATPESGNIASYELGYWTSSISVPTTIAEPAWIFTSTTGRTYAVDAGSGALIGTESL